MVDVFLMGTSGKFDDPHRSKWRDPIKLACQQAGYTCYDPVVPEWNDEAMRAEIDALRGARIVVMAITADTAGIASLAESGWVAMSALYRKQAFGLFVDDVFVAEGFDPRLSQASGDLVRYLFGKGKEKNVAELAESSRRARKLVDGHAHELSKQFPELNMFVARNLHELTQWTVSTARRLIPHPGTR